MVFQGRERTILDCAKYFENQLSDRLDTPIGGTERCLADWQDTEFFEAVGEFRVHALLSFLQSLK